MKQKTKNKKQKTKKLKEIFCYRDKVFHAFWIRVFHIKYIIFWFICQGFSPVAISQKLYLAVDAGVTQSYKAHDKSLVQSKSISVTGWQAGISTHLLTKNSMFIDVGINYVIDGGGKEFLNNVNPNERVSLSESMRWVEVPAGLNINIYQSRFRLGASIAYRYLLKSTAELSITSLSDTFHLTSDFTEYRKRTVFFGGFHAGYQISKKSIIEIQYKRNFGDLNDGWDPSLLIQDEPFSLNIFILRFRYFILPLRDRISI